MTKTVAHRAFVPHLHLLCAVLQDNGCLRQYQNCIPSASHPALFPGGTWSHFVAAGDAGADVGPLCRRQRHQCGAAGAPGKHPSLPPLGQAPAGSCSLHAASCARWNTLHYDHAARAPIRLLTIAHGCDEVLLTSTGGWRKAAGARLAAARSWAATHEARRGVANLPFG